MIKINSPKQYGLENIANSGDLYDLPIEKLPKGSHIKITAICDNCQKERSIVYKTYYNITHNNEGKYFCKQCNFIKRKKTCLERYGVENVMQLESSKQKMYNLII